MLKPEGEFLL